MCDLLLGADVGGETTKLVIVRQPGLECIHAVTVPVRPDGPDLRRIPASAWGAELRAWASQTGLAERIGAIGVAVAAPMVGPKLVDQTRKIADIDGTFVPIFEADQARSAGSPFYVTHDAAAHLWWWLASGPSAHGTTGILALGSSIGFAFAISGRVVEGPYTPWPSHMQLRPGYARSGASPTACDRCGQTGCFRQLYADLRGTATDPRLDRLPELVDVLAQGISSLLCILPLTRLLLSGGYTRHWLSPAAADIRNVGSTLLQQLTRCLEERIPFLRPVPIGCADMSDYAGALGAAWMAGRKSAASAPHTTHAKHGRRAVRSPRDRADS